MVNVRRIPPHSERDVSVVSVVGARNVATSLGASDSRRTRFNGNQTVIRKTRRVLRGACPGRRAPSSPAKDPFVPVVGAPVVPAAIF